VEKIKTHILCSVTFFENRAVCEIMWKNIVEPGGPWATYGACALHAGYLRLKTHSEYVILIAFTLQQWMHKRSPVLRYTYVAGLVSPVFTG
jgi:hypothetical protein